MTNSSSMTVVTRILWTGGWDSTYRIVELSRQKSIIEPFYVYGDNRLSEKKEINAMKKILIELKRKKETKAQFLPIKFISKDSIPKNQDITEAYNKIAKETNLGSQHEWLARLAAVYPGLEIGTESAPLEVSNILRAINMYGKLIFDSANNTYILDQSHSTKEAMLVLGNFKYPIIHLDGKQMRENIKQWGYEDVMKNVWVCHTPLFGGPCGICHPCELKIETGMDFLMSPRALKRYKNRKKQPYKFIYSIEKKLFRYLNKIMSKATSKRKE